MLSDSFYGKSDYDAIEIDDEEDLFERPVNKKRWSVMEKLDRRYYCQIRSCYDCLRILKFRCCIATLMLVLFVVLAFFFTRAVFFNAFAKSQHYDFIVVGGGSAGSVISRRLVESGARVILLEAGDTTQFDLGGTDFFGGPLSRFDIPLLWSAVAQSEDSQWQGFNVPDVIQGKGVGGSGILSSMLYVRAVATDITNWNIPSWTWDKMFKVFKEMDYFRPTDQYLEDNNRTNFMNFHGNEGLIVSSPPLIIDEIGKIFISAAKNAGLDFLSDFNNPSISRHGVGFYHMNIRDGKRESIASAMLGSFINGQGSKHSSLFTLESNAFVRKVITRRVRRKADDDSDKVLQAVGVEYEKNGEIHQVYLSHFLSEDQRQSFFEQKTSTKFLNRRCVVLTAGALMTPKILMNSGIGPEKQLESLGIEVQVDSPAVGKNLQDQPAVGLTLRLLPSISAGLSSSFSFPQQWIQYTKYLAEERKIKEIQKTSEPIQKEKTPKKSHRKTLESSLEDSLGTMEVSNLEPGVLGSVGFSSGAFLVSPYANSSKNVNSEDMEVSPDIQVTIYPTLLEPHWIKRNGHQGLDEKKYNHGNEILIIITLLHPESRQQVVLDPIDNYKNPPLIQPQNSKNLKNSDVLTELDIKRIEWGIKKTREIIDTSPFVEYIDHEIEPGIKISESNELSEWIKSNWFSQSNWVGSASLGNGNFDLSPPSDSVLDPALRVNGLKGLRVADASSIPLLPSGNVQATVAAVAWMAVDSILNGEN